MTYIGTLFSLALVWVFLLVGPALAAIAIKRSLAIRWQIALMGLCVLYAIAPLLLLGVGLILSDNWNCPTYITVNNGCPEAGQFEGILALLLFAPWGLMFTIPSGFLGLVGLLFSFILKMNRSRSPQTPTAGRPFYRSRRHKAIAGICAALSQLWGMPLLGLRIAIVVLTLVLPILVPPLYIWCWLAFPLEPSAQST